MAPDRARARPVGRPRRTAPPAGSCAATARAAQGARDSHACRRAAPGVRARCPRPGAHRRSLARSSPSGSATRSRASAAARRPRPAPRLLLEAPDVGVRLVHRRRERLVDERGIVAGHEDRPVAVARQQRAELVVADAREHGRVRDLPAVQVQDRQHGTVRRRIEELVRVPARRERPRLRLAVADHAGDQQVGVVEGSAVGVAERVAELAALVDRAGRLGCDVAGNATRERELTEQLLHALGVAGDRRPELGVGALEPGAGAQGGTAVTRSGDEQRIDVVRQDQPVDVRVDEVQARRGPPVPEQPRFDVLGAQRLAQERVVEQVDLPDREIVGGAPPGVDARELTSIERCRAVGGSVHAGLLPSYER